MDATCQLVINTDKLWSSYDHTEKSVGVTNQVADKNYTTHFLTKPLFIDPYDSAGYGKVDDFGSHERS